MGQLQQAVFSEISQKNLPTTSIITQSQNLESQDAFRII